MAQTVTLSGTKVTKSGSDAALNFVLFLGKSASTLKGDPQGRKKLTGDLGVFDGKVTTLEGLRNFFNISWSGRRSVQNTSKPMPRGKHQDNSIKFLMDAARFDKIMNYLEENLDAQTEGTVNYGGKPVFKYDYNREENKLNYSFHISVAAFPSAYTGQIDSTAPDMIASTPDHNILSGSTEGYEYFSKINICSGLLKCKENKDKETTESLMRKLGFKRSGKDRYESIADYKLTASICEELGVSQDSDNKYEGPSGTFFFTFPTVNFCDFPTDKLCAQLENVHEGGGDKALVKGTNYRLSSDGKGGENLVKNDCDNSSCKVEGNLKKPIFDVLARHLCAAGFTQIDPSSFNPVEVLHKAATGSGDEQEQYNFVGYSLDGRYVNYIDLASKSSRLIDIKAKPVSIFPVLKGSTKRDKETGALDYQLTQDIAFATGDEGLKKIGESEAYAGSGKVFSHEVYANVVKDTVYKMAEVWKQTAHLTLNQDNIPYGRRDHVYHDQILSPGGGSPIDTYTYGTDLELEKQLFQTFESHAAAAGYKLTHEKIEFAMDMVFKQSEDAEGAETQMASASASITIKNIIQLIKTGSWEEGAVKDSITVDFGNVDLLSLDSSEAYDVEGITVKYTTGQWNNWKLDFGFAPFFESEDGGLAPWESFNTKATWTVSEGKMMTLSADADGNLGLEASWRINTEEKETYDQEGLVGAVTRGLNGAWLQSGFMYDLKTGKIKPSASLKKSFNKAVDLSISLTGADVAVKLQEQYGSDERAWGNLDIAFQGSFGVKWPNQLHQTEDNPSGMPKEELIDINYKNKTLKTPEKPSWNDLKKFAKLELNIDNKKTLLKLGHNMGKIVYSANLSATAGTRQGVIEGISMRTFIKWQVEYQNNILYEIFGLPLNVNPYFGGSLGFSMHKVKNEYFGTEYTGHQWTVGAGAFGINFVSHSRKDVILGIIERKKYNSTIPFIGNLLGWAEHETDEDYVARAWPCLVLNIVNWSKEDFKKNKYGPDVKKMKDSIWESKWVEPNCEILKNLQDIGMSLSNYYENFYANAGFGGYDYLSEHANAFYEGRDFTDSQYTFSQGPYKVCNGEINYWDRWIDGDEISTNPLLLGLGADKTVIFPRTEKKPPGGVTNLPCADSNPPELKVSDIHTFDHHLNSATRDKTGFKGKFIDQQGNTIDTKIVKAVRNFNKDWKNWPNMDPDGDTFPTWDQNNPAFASSATLAYIYYRRELFWGKNSCDYLFKRWKESYIKREQLPYVRGLINKQLSFQRPALQNEIEGLTKDRSTTDSLFDQFYEWITGKKEYGKPKNIKFDLSTFMEDNKSLYGKWNETSNTYYHGPLYPVAGEGNSVGASAGQPWVGFANHQVRTFSGAGKAMHMLTSARARKGVFSKSSPDERDEESAVELYFSDPAWGLVKCYFTYMAPIGEHESMKVKDGKRVYNPLYNLPYDPRTDASTAKRKEIRDRNLGIINGAQSVFSDSGYKPFNIDELDKNKKKKYKDSYGNLAIEMFKDYRPGWVYTQRRDNALGEIVWVIPTPDLHKHVYSFDFDETKDEGQNIIIKYLMKGADAAGAGEYTNVVTNACKVTEENSDKGMLSRLWNWLVGNDNFFLDGYRSLPWVYTDQTNAEKAIGRGLYVDDPPATNALTKGSFTYFPNKTLDQQDLPYPFGTQVGAGKGNISYQQVPWKGNVNSSYLDFYEFMTRVETEAKAYFFPELMEGHTSKSINSFCIVKEQLVKAFGILDKDFILKDCKYCDDCLSRGVSSGADVENALGEVVGLKSLMGEVHSPSEDKNPSLSDSAQYQWNRPWFEYNGSNAGSRDPAYRAGAGLPELGQIVNVYNPSSSFRYTESSNQSFASIHEKFDHVNKRISKLAELVNSAKTVLAQSSPLLIKFENAESYDYPNSSAANKVTYSYDKGESLSSMKELLSLNDIVLRHSDVNRSFDSPRNIDISYNLNTLRTHFVHITQDPKHVNSSGVHKFWAGHIKNDSNTFGSKSIGKQGAFSNAAALSVAVNRIVRKVKDIAQHLTNNKAQKGAAYWEGFPSDPIRSMLESINGVNQGLTNQTIHQPVKDFRDSYILQGVGGGDAHKKDFLSTMIADPDNDDSKMSIGEALFGGSFENFKRNPHWFRPANEPCLSQSYIDYSTSLIRSFVPTFSTIEWIYGTEKQGKKNGGGQKGTSLSVWSWLDNVWRPYNYEVPVELFGGIKNQDKDTATLVNKSNMRTFFSFVRGDLLASQYVTSLALSGWTDVALDVLMAYWSNKITYHSCIWNLNRRLWPLMNAMNDASPFIYHNEGDLEILRAQAPKYLEALKKWGITPTSKAIESRDFYKGMAVSFLGKYAGPIGVASITDANYTNDDVAFVHRNNVLRLLFRFDHVVELIPPPRDGTGFIGGRKKAEIYLRGDGAHLLPITALGCHQCQADRYELSQINPDKSPIPFSVSNDITNSLCKANPLLGSSPYSNLAGDPSGKTIRPYGRDRFGVDVPSFISNYTPQAGLSVKPDKSWVYTARIMGDDKAGVQTSGNITRVTLSKLLKSSGWGDDHLEYQYLQGVTPLTSSTGKAHIDIFGPFGHIYKVDVAAGNYRRGAHEYWPRESDADLINPSSGSDPSELAG